MQQTLSGKAGVVRSRGEGEETAPITPASCSSPGVTGPSRKAGGNTGSRR